MHHLHPDGSPFPIEECPIDRALPERAATRGEDVFVHRDGHFYPVSFTASPLVQEGRPVGTLIEFRDTTDERAARRERERMLAEMRKAVAVRDEFLSIASHELRTPLTALELQLEGIRRAIQGTFDPARVSQKIARASDQLARLNVLIEGLLDVSRIATGRFRLHVEEFEVTALVRDVVERFEEAARRAGSPLRVVGAGEVSVRWDRSRIDQVLTNLLANAIKYGQGRPIDVGASLRSTDGLDDEVVLEVTDRGIGIPAEDRARIFGRFERAVSSNQYGGLGLGLFIASEIVAAHDGRIELQSELGEGTTFKVVLPRFSGAPPSS